MVELKRKLLVLYSRVENEKVRYRIIAKILANKKIFAKLDLLNLLFCFAFSQKFKKPHFYFYSMEGPGTVKKLFQN